MTITAGHQADPASYDCRSCELPWPCEPAREYLLSTTPDAVQLGIRLWVELEQAAGVLRHEPPSALFDRFLKWARHPAAADPPTGRSGTMSEQDLRLLAERCADVMAKEGDVFVEDDKVDGLAAMLQAFLLTAGLSPAGGVLSPAGGGQSTATG
jgi:hypothetical protein